jgi:geranylgeranyl pyrophosphate synthase
MNFRELYQRVPALLEEAFIREQERYLAHSPLREMLGYHYASGGKRLRPFVVFGSAAAQAGSLSEALWRSCVPYALAVELIHNATLIHDDLQDGDRTRRGQPTIWARYSAAQAINCGDAWFFVPSLLVQEAAYAPELKLRLLDLLHRKTLAVIDGQSREFALKERFAAGAEISVADYDSMVHGKTSALFSMPLLGGALIAGARETAALEASAALLGRASQIQDDLLDLWGEKGREAPAQDIAEGKLSYPLLLLLQALPTGEARKRVEAIVRAPREATAREDIRWVLARMEEKGVKERAKEDFRRCLAEARRTGNALVLHLADWLAESVREL